MDQVELKYIDNTSLDKDKYVITYYNYENFGLVGSTLGKLSSQIYDNLLKVENINKSESGRIISLDINNNNFKGRTFQKLLSLRSNDFSIIEKQDTIEITTRGFGHGVGLSQYGANALAKQNKSYEEILKYYYQGTELKKL